MSHRRVVWQTKSRFVPFVSSWLIFLLFSQPAPAANYKNFTVAVYVTVNIVQQMKDPQWLADNWQRLSSQVKIDKVYLETYRSRRVADEASLEPIKKFFTDRGIAVAGGMALQDTDSNGVFRSLCYTDPADREYIKSFVAMTARHFDEIILDDFFFVTTKNDSDIAAKGDRSWTQFRLDLMDDAAENLLLKPARAANPKVRIIIKFPNWYEHFQGLGYDLDKEPKLFDGIYTGTETRDPVNSEQHLQPYESYSIVRYFDNIAPKRNGGGWVDPFGLRFIDRYPEQLWGTLFAKAPEITLFTWGVLNRPATINDDQRKAWADRPTSFDFAAITKIDPSPTFARVAGAALEQADAIVGKLGNPIGVKSYRPPHATGEDFLHNYLGMIGIPIDLEPTFPEGADPILLTESAKFDPQIVKKIEAQLVAGKTVIITSGLLRALQDKGIQDICELQYTGHVAAITEFQGRGGAAIDAPKLATPILIPQIQFLTNDAWALITGVANGNGFPLLIMDHYSRGTLFVLTIPENPNDLFSYPQQVLTAIKNLILHDAPVRIYAPAQVSLFTYDNGAFIVESFLPTESDVTISIAGENPILSDLPTGQYIPGQRQRAPFRNFGGATTRPSTQFATPPRYLFNVKIEPHSFRAFSVEE